MVYKKQAGRHTKRRLYFVNKVILACLCLVVSVSGFSQTHCDSVKNLRLRNNSFQCKWNYFKIKDSIVGVVIRHEKQRMACEVSPSASVTIVATGTDTVRIIDFCNDYNLKRGMTLLIFPADPPNYQVDIPFYYDVVDEKNNVFVNRTNEYDERILKTAWGDITVP